MSGGWAPKPKGLPLWVFALPSPIFRLIVKAHYWWHGGYDPMRADRECSNTLSCCYRDDPR